MNNLKRAIIASLTSHPNAEEYRRRAFVENPAQLVEALAQGQTLTKADFFAIDDKGKAFLDNPGARENFTKIAEIIGLGGEKFTYDDFVSPMVPGSYRTLLDNLKMDDGLKKIFTFEVWKGRFDEMEKLWYKLSTIDRSKVPGSKGITMPIELKRELLAAEGRTAPEDRLAKAKVSDYDLSRMAVSDYYFNQVITKLRQAGDHLRKEYVMMPDSSGDTLFDGESAHWSKFEDVVRELQSHGERLEVGDYLRRVSYAQSILERAAAVKALDKVFAPEQWVDHLPDMLDLWSHVLDGWKTGTMTTQNFDNAYAEAQGLTYSKHFTARQVGGKADLLTPLNKGMKEKPVLPLGLKVVWDNLYAIQEHLHEKGESLTIADLRQPSGQMGDSCLISAAKFGCFDKVVDIAKQNGERITLEDFLSKDGHGNTLLGILAKQKLLPQVFTSEMWTGRAADMKELWSHVPAVDRKQVNYTQLETSLKQAALRQQRKGGKIKIGPRPPS